MINIEEEYIGLLSGILHGGKFKEDRTGTGTLSAFGRMIYHDMALGFPILTTKKINVNHVITELLWIVNGRTDLKYLHSHGVKYGDMVLPPCHYSFQIYCNDGKIDLMWQQRSVDVFLGLPYDISIYGLLLELLAKGCNLKAGRLIGSFGDCHLYKNHLSQAQTLLKRKKFKLPTLKLNKGISLKNNKLITPRHGDIKLSNYKHSNLIPAELNT